MIKQRDDKLTKDEELELGHKIQAMKELKVRMDAGHTKLTQEENRVLVEGEHAFEMLVGNYYNLARDIAHRHHRRTGTRYEIEDLLQDAIGALCEAAYDYDPGKNCKLSTYAFYGITKRVSTTINYQRLVRMPENKMIEYSKILKAQQDYAQLVDDEQIEDISELEYIYDNVGDLKKEEVDLILTNMQPQVSLNAIVGENGGSELMGLIPSEKEFSYQKKYDDLDDSILEVLSRLSEEEVDLLSYEFEAIPERIPYEEFLRIHELTDRRARTQIRRAVRKMRSVAAELKEENKVII